MPKVKFRSSSVPSLAPDARLSIRNAPENASGSFDRLRKLVAESGNNRNDTAIVAITGCITERIDTSKAIFEMLVRLGFDSRHATLILKKGTGNDPERHRWSRDDSGRYRLLD